MSFEEASKQIILWRACRTSSGTFLLTEMRMKYEAGTYRSQESHPELPGGCWDFDGKGKLFYTPPTALRRDIGYINRIIRVEGKRLGTNSRLMHIEYWTKNSEAAEAVRDALFIGHDLGRNERMG
jgi:hypothetical protein